MGVGARINPVPQRFASLALGVGKARSCHSSPAARTQNRARVADYGEGGGGQAGGLLPVVGDYPGDFRLVAEEEVVYVFQDAQFGPKSR